MVILSHSDLYKVELASLIADYDKTTLVDLYMPIIGYEAMSIYFVLWSEGAKKHPIKFNQHETFLIKMHMPTGVFVDARKKLEALGLLKTYLKKGEDVSIYTYELYAPKTPNKFFNDTLLYGLLIKSIGEKEAIKMKLSFKLDNEKIDGSEISSSFAEVFKPDYNDVIYKMAMNNVDDLQLDRKQSLVDFEFNYDKFIVAIKENSQISENIFNKKILKEIERLSTLYGIDENTAALDVIDCFDMNRPAGDKIDFKKLTYKFQDEVQYPFLRKNNNDTKEDNTISSNTDLGNKINLMEMASCKDFLKLLQGGKTPVQADLNLIDDLSSKLGLKNGVINAIIDYSLQRNDNKLTRSYVEKVAASVARENIETAYDAMNYLSKSKKRKSNKTSIKKDVEKPIVEEKVNVDEDEDDNIDWVKLFKNIG